jgi:hypothetical protein
MFEPVFGPRARAQSQGTPRNLRSPGATGHVLAAAFAAACFASAPSNASAADKPGNDDNEASYKPPPIERRGNFTFGVTPVATLAHYSGSLNEVAKLDDPEFHESTTSPGWGVTAWFGGTLRDWFSFGLGYSLSSTFGDPQGESGAYVLRLEGFPAYSLGGPYRDLGVALDFGISSGVLERDDANVADGGDMAHVGATAFYEPFRFWKLSMGPALSYGLDFSQSMTVNTYGLGWRVAFYGTQPK